VPVSSMAASRASSGSAMTVRAPAWRYADCRAESVSPASRVRGSRLTTTVKRSGRSRAGPAGSSSRAVVLVTRSELM